jgi:hypothetical protein
MPSTRRLHLAFRSLLTIALSSAVIVTSAVVVIPAQPAWAQGSTPTARAEARRFLREGSKLFAQGNHAAALEKFERALQIFPSARIKYNVGQALRELGRPVEAVEAFEMFLAKADRISSVERREATAALKELEATVAKLTLTTNLSDVEVTIDGRSVGKTPLPGHLVLTAGTHDVTLGRPGYKLVREPMTLAGGEHKRARFELVQNDLPVAVVPPAPIVAPPVPLPRTLPSSAAVAPEAAPGPSVLEAAPITTTVGSEPGGNGWRSQTVVGVALLAASAACAVGAGVLMASSWSRYNDAKDSCGGAGNCEAEADDVDSTVLWSKLLVGAAALTGVGGAATLLFVPTSHPGDVSRSGLMLSGRGTF